jgi:3-hydroxyacyl-[acyl-carrier-protein] dehydratase
LLLNDLYTIQSLTETDHQIQATVKLKSDHAIFKGHFPGQPVLPGVCMMEMISEITGEWLRQSFGIAGGPMIKFLHMIDPQKNPQVSLEIKYQYETDRITTSGRIYSGSEVFMKFQLNLVAEKRH